MRHAKKGKKFATDASHRKAILKSMAASLLEHEKIKTTEVRAKELRPVVEGVITLAKRGDVHARRQAMAVLGDKELVHRVFSEIGPRFADRSGGYTRIVKIGPRQGDAAPMVQIELV
ncbi:MAG: 50S ribosomal protein L17 [Actinobacteria bacterium]|jgi:large subunit ribosomal protein L17|nr:MAG: 50S ribosomal protein L17 [Actinomycetota bacterium]